MLIDCGTCRGHTQGRCGGCVVTVLATLPRPRAVWPPGAGFSASPDLPSAGQAVAASTLHRDKCGELGGDDSEDGWLPLDGNEATAVDVFVQAGLIRGDEAARLRARPQTGRRHRAVG